MDVTTEINNKIQSMGGSGSSNLTYLASNKSLLFAKLDRPIESRGIRTKIIKIKNRLITFPRMVNIKFNGLNNKKLFFDFKYFFKNFLYFITFRN